MKTNRTSKKTWVTALLCLGFTSACGTSIFVHAEKKNSAEDATINLEKNQPDAAIGTLNKALAKDPENTKLIALLSSATAQKYGIDVVTIALQMAKNSSTPATTSSSSSGASSGTNGITALFSVLPASTDENINGIQGAISIMETIPAALRTAADNFMLTLMHTAVLGLVAKQFDKDGDGLISPVEMLSITPDAAVAILANLLAAQEVLAMGTGATGGSSSAAMAAVGHIQTAIDNAPGSSDQEKLVNYLSNGAKVPTTAPTATLPTTSSTTTLPTSTTN